MPTTDEEGTDMYPNRRNNKPLLITGVVMAAAIAGLVTLNFVVRKPKAPVETEARRMTRS